MSWYRSPSGRLAHADGPSQTAAYLGRGYTPVDETQATAEIAAGVELRLDPTDTAGTFDADAVQAAVRDETTTPRRRRS